MVTVTVRLIRSFEYRSITPLVIHQLDVSQTVEDFISKLKHEIQTRPGFNKTHHRCIQYVSVKCSQLRTFLIYEHPSVPRCPGLLPPFRNHPYDTLKLYCHAQGMKPNDLVINKENDSELILRSDKTLSAYNVASETELSYFIMHEYEAYKSGDETKW